MGQRHTYGIKINSDGRLTNTMVEHKDSKKSNEMYYPRFTKVIIHHFMSKDPSILKRNKPKASVRKTRSSSDTTITPPTAAAGSRLTIFEKGKQAAKVSKAKSLSALSELTMTEAQQLKLVTKRSMHQTHISQASGSGADEGTGSILRVLDIPTDESEEELSWNSTDEEVERDDEKDDEEEGGDDEQEYDEDEYDEETRDEEIFDPISKTPETVMMKAMVKNKQEKDKIRTKPDQIKKKREAWKSLVVSKTNHSQESRKEKKIQVQGTKQANLKSCINL
nr:hypothetical protein [Tanacetum cinerariifolium]